MGRAVWLPCTQFCSLGTLSIPTHLEPGTYSPGAWNLLTWHLVPGTYSPGNWHLITWLPQSADLPVHTWGQADCPTPWEHWLCPPRPVFFRPSSVISDVIACPCCYNWSHAQLCFLFQHCFQNNFIRYNRKSQQGRLGLWICYHDCLFDVNSLLLSSKSCLSCVLLDWYCSNDLKLLLWHFGLNEILELAELIICKEFLMESRVKRGKYCQAKQRVQVSYCFVRSWAFNLIFSPQQLLCVWSLETASFSRRCKQLWGVAGDGGVGTHSYVKHT